MVGYRLVFGSFGFGSQMPAVTTREVLNPGSSLSSPQNVRSSNPAPIISTTVSAISDIISEMRYRPILLLWPEPRDPSRMLEYTSVFDDCSAGTRPNAKPVMMEISSANPRTPQSMLTSLSL